MSISITSSQNPRVKFAESLKKAAVRKKEKLFLIEGLREIRLAMQAGYQFNTLLVCRQVADNLDIDSLADDLVGQVQVIEITPGIFGKLAYRDRSDGLIAIALQKDYSLSDISFSGVPLLIVVEAVEKPGNLGAILRTADAGGVDAVIVCDGITDIYNPNVVRSSLGSMFTRKIVCCSSGDAITWLKNNKINIFTTSLSASRPYHHNDFTLPAAIVAGAEATGVTPAWEESSDYRIIIPMFGKVDSINVASATSIVLYEALRQRGFPEAKIPEF
jgi:RNA methyltransferase, TrmH family